MVSLPMNSANPSCFWSARCATRNASNKSVQCAVLVPEKGHNGFHKFVKSPRDTDFGELEPNSLLIAAESPALVHLGNLFLVSQALTQGKGCNYKVQTELPRLQRKELNIWSTLESAAKDWSMWMFASNIIHSHPTYTYLLHPASICRMETRRDPVWKHLII